MTGKVHKIRAFLVGIADADGVSTILARAIEKKILPYIDSLQEEPVSDELEEEPTDDIEAYQSRWGKSNGYLAEPVSEDMEEELHSYIKSNFTIDKEQLERFGIEEKDYMYSMDESDMLALVEHFTNWQKQKEYTCYEEAFEDGAKWKVENLWKPADGDDLPPIDKEVVVFTQNFPNDVGMMSVAIAHRPNPDGWDGKSVTTGKVEHYIPKTYDKGGWNIPDVKWWLDIEKLPNMDD